MLSFKNHNFERLLNIYFLLDLHFVNSTTVHACLGMGWCLCFAQNDK
jgi:hypothetical protein